MSTNSGIIKSVDAGFCALLQRRESDLVGVSYQSITVAADIPKSAEMLQSLSDRTGPRRLRKRYHRPDGTFIEADLLVSPIEGTDDLVTTLAWEDQQTPVATPLGMWKAALRVRHLYLLRMQELGTDLFCDFVGAILIQAYLAEAEGRIVTVDDIADSIGLKHDTTTRWVQALRQRDLLQAAASTGTAIQLSHLGIIKVERLMSAIANPIDHQAI
ncbi:hypothetical protein ASG67_14085 [Sphingomonas sp. Leaf339]|nr:hypothetical protein ASG67_14085 [Sphingomonas sp. Leaf339]